MSYERQTRGDASQLKRWVQNRRLADAVSLSGIAGSPTSIVDYGAGDGALSLALADHWPQAQITCFEPIPAMRAEAERLTAGHPRITVVPHESAIPAGADLIVCAEVFEHLPSAAFDHALNEIERVAAPDGLIVLGVPVETGPPALAKGAFRMSRRYGAEDARIGRVLAAAFGRPPTRIPHDLADGRPYLHAHLGFDQRAFERAIRARFILVKRRYSPFNLGSWLASELYLAVRRR
ncbi:MAG: class I SAM-dependent methyltransferase [Micropepsaceae bacterium]